MECARCHQPVSEEGCYCPACGLPQLVYSAEPGTVPASSERWPEAVRDASSIDWKVGIRTILVLAAVAGILASRYSPVHALGLFWMAAAAAWAVLLYMRRQGPAWITLGAGARIGMVTGLIAGWLAFGFSGAGFFVTRVVRHQGNQIDSGWHAMVDQDQQITQQLIKQAGIPVDAAQVNAQRNWMLSPEAHAGLETMQLARNSLLFLLCAVAGGALGARTVGRRRRPEI
jgi:hypothetical protein